MMVKLFIVLFAFLHPFVHGATNRPGYCDKTTTCPSGYSCISVTSTITGTSQASACTPSPPGSLACAGLHSGLCPTFANWPKAYRSISPVCAFYTPDNCKNESDPDASKDANTTVDCFNIEFNGQTRFGIFKCVDYQQYMTNRTYYSANWTQSHLDKCASNSSSGVCNGYGTCSPVQKDSLYNYTCKCLPGYSSKDNCYKARTNECGSVTQCGAYGNCTGNGNSMTCECFDGATGLQCRLCDNSSSNVCSKQGVCNANGTCTCDSGYGGDFCDITAFPGGSSDAVVFSQFFSMSMVLLIILAVNPL